MHLSFSGCDSSASKWRSLNDSELRCGVFFPPNLKPVPARSIGYRSRSNIAHEYPHRPNPLAESSMIERFSIASINRPAGGAFHTQQSGSRPRVIDNPRRVINLPSALSSTREVKSEPGP